MWKFFNIVLFSLFLISCGPDTGDRPTMPNDGSYRLALDNSLTKWRLGFAAKYLAVSGESTGQAKAYRDSDWSNSILLYPGYSGLVDVKESLYVDVGPQPGKFLQLEYGDVPITVTTPLKTANEPSLNVLTYRNSFAVGGSDVIVLESINTRGIKILGGVISTYVFNDAAKKYVYSELVVTAGLLTTTLIVVPVENNAFTNYANFGVIPQLIIPPNLELQIAVRGSAGFGSGFIFLNYELL